MNLKDEWHLHNKAVPFIYYYSPILFKYKNQF